MKAIRRFTVRPVLPEPLRPLSDLARNLRWSWHPETRELFQALDPEGWQRAGADPVRLLGTVTAERLTELAGDRRFLRRLTAAADDLQDYLTGRRWYQSAGDRLPAAIAYFSPEFGITAALPQYSGGLGILAGDHLKAASDLGVPLIGVGLLYRHGYFRQSLSREGWQQEHYPVLDPNELPLELLREPDGTPAQVALALPGGRRLRSAIWRARVGRVPLLLLDSDVEENGHGERQVTDRLYGGGSEHRLLQEMLLGIGGVRAVRTYCRLTGHPAPEVFHTNEGHAGFLGLERIRELSEDGGLAGGLDERRDEAAGRHAFGEGLGERRDEPLGERLDDGLDVGGSQDGRGGQEVSGGRDDGGGDHGGDRRGEREAPDDGGRTRNEAAGSELAAEGAGPDGLGGDGFAADGSAVGGSTVDGSTADGAAAHGSAAHGPSAPSSPPQGGLGDQGDRGREGGHGGVGGPGGLDFDSALEAVRAGTVFTTHTPVPAGIDRFDRDLVARHFGPDAELPGIDPARVIELGRETYPGGDPQVFNMAVMGLRLAQRANGVSTLHGAVSREMFAGLWPGFDPEEVPITSITNGVHAPTWVAPEVFRLGARQIGAGRAEDALTVGGSPRWSAVADIPGPAIWDLRRTLREQLVTEVRTRLRAAWRERGAATAELGWIDSVLDPDVLTIGFARRVPSYKRLTLMLRDPERLRELLLHPERPVQIVVAGKAHPADDSGKRLVQELVEFADDPEVRRRIVFLPDYGMAMAKKLYPGCDVWLNNPLRPLEACGTSGMKAALNGCLNLSVLDGWWDEWYGPDFGWSIPTADGSATDEDRRDDLEATALYDLLEHRIAPGFYDRDPAGVPRRWVEMVRHTLVTLGPKVLAGRMVREYVEQLYAPAARAHRALTPDAARALARWKVRVRAAWPGVAVDHVEAGTPDAPANGTAELGGTLALRVWVTLDSLAPEDVEVQLVSGRVDATDRIADPLTAPLKPVGGPDLEGRWLYEGPLSLDRTGPFGYTVRILPSHKLLATSAELGLLSVPSEAIAEAAGVLLR